MGIAGGIALLLILFVSYYCGGYVAGRMARFNGMKQGVAVWLWAVVIAVVVAVLGAVAGSKFDVLAKLNSFPRIPVNEGTLSTGGIIALLVVAVASLRRRRPGRTRRHALPPQGGPGRPRPLTRTARVNDAPARCAASGARAGEDAPVEIESLDALDAGPGPRHAPLGGLRLQGLDLRRRAAGPARPAPTSRGWWCSAGS